RVHDLARRLLQVANAQTEIVQVVVREDLLAEQQQTMMREVGENPVQPVLVDGGDVQPGDLQAEACTERGLVHSGTLWLSGVSRRNRERPTGQLRTGPSPAPFRRFLRPAFVVLPWRHRPCGNLLR